MPDSWGKCGTILRGCLAPHLTYAMMRGIVILIIILFMCFTQHISMQCSINKTALQVLMALKSPYYTPSQGSDQSLDGRDPWDHPVGCSSSPPCVTCLWSDISLRADSQWWVRSWKTGQLKTGTVQYTGNPSSWGSTMLRQWHPGSH